MEYVSRDTLKSDHDFCNRLQVLRDCCWFADSSDLPIILKEFAPPLSPSLPRVDLPLVSVPTPFAPTDLRLFSVII